MAPQSKLGSNCTHFVRRRRVRSPSGAWGFCPNSAGKSLMGHETSRPRPQIAKASCHLSRTYRHSPRNWSCHSRRQCRKARFCSIRIVKASRIQPMKLSMLVCSRALGLVRVKATRVPNARGRAPLTPQTRERDTSRASPLVAHWPLGASILDWGSEKPCSPGAMSDAHWATLGQQTQVLTMQHSSWHADCCGAFCTGATSPLSEVILLSRTKNQASQGWKFL